MTSYNIRVRHDDRNHSVITVPLNGTLTVMIPVELDAVALRAAGVEELVAAMTPIVADEIRSVLSRVLVEDF